MMNKKLISPIIISLVLSFLICESTGYFGIGKVGITSCDDNHSYLGYCQDCLTNIVCSDGKNTSTETCASTESCEESSIYSACGDAYLVPDCYCSAGETSQKPDPYDKHKYVKCDNGVRHLFVCPADGVFNPNTLTCGEDGGGGCPAGNDQNIVAAINCTCYVNCYDDGSQSDTMCCDVGEVFNNITIACEKYEVFTCSDKVDGRYSDPHNCSIYYTCVNNEQFGDALKCDFEFHFDDDKQTCVEDDDNTKCKTEEECDICQGHTAYIEVDCQNYYECEKGEDSKYSPQAKTCPGGTCFSAESGFCEVTYK